jgi:hypothetical protein
MKLKLDFEQMADVTIAYIKECLYLELKFDKNEKTIKRYFKILKEIMPEREYNGYKENFKKDLRLDRGEVSSFYNKYTQDWI